MMRNKSLPSLELHVHEGNGMLRHSIGGEVIYFSLQHIIAPALDFLPCLQAWDMRDCNKGI